MFKGSLSRKTGLDWAMPGVGLLAAVSTSLQVKQCIGQAAVRQFAYSCGQATLNTVSFLRLTIGRNHAD